MTSVRFDVPAVEFNGLAADIFRQEFLEKVAQSKDEHLNISPGASGIASCRRSQYYRLHDYPNSSLRPLADQGEDRIAAEMGNAVETKVYEHLRAVGIHVQDAQSAWAMMSCGEWLYGNWDKKHSPDEVLALRIVDHQNREQHNCHVVITGHPDGLFTVVETRVLLEIKFMNFRRYADMSANGIAFFEDYVAQIHSNMAAYGAKKALLLAFSKDKTAVKTFKRGQVQHGFMHVELVDFDASVVKAVVERAAEVVDKRDKKELPARDHNPEGGERADWQCRWDKYHGQCLADGA
jgi:hypothetical protein